MEGVDKAPPPTPLVTFVYLLCRNDLPAGKVERLVAEATDDRAQVVRFSNGWLAEYARNVAERLLV